MRDNNPYEAPKTSFDETQPGQVAPPIWNPNAAANWSLLFSPVFGATVHMKNWQALGEPGRAATSRNWAIASGVILLGSVFSGLFMADDKLGDAFARLLGFVMLISWYVASGRAQAKYVNERYGKNYARKGWGKPLIYAVLAVVAFFIVMFIVGIVLAALGFAPQSQ